MKIYTKTGDKGETGFVGGRVSKDSNLIHTIGSMDELNASIGVCVTYLKESSQSDYIFLQKCQNLIFYIGSILSGAKVELNLDNYVIELEQEIDRLSNDLPTLTNFILPGGTKESAYIHLARTICRRAERELSTLLTKNKDLPKNLKIDLAQLNQSLKFINRFSDYLFTLARFINHQNKTLDTIWNKEIE